MESYPVLSFPDKKNSMCTELEAGEVSIEPNMETLSFPCQILIREY